MNAEQRAAALELAGKGVQVNDGHTYGVKAADLVAYADTIRALVAELDRVAPVCSCVEDVRCAPCMTGAVDPVTGMLTPPADNVPGGCIYCSSSGVIEDYDGDRPCSNCGGTGTPRPRGTVIDAEALAKAWDDGVRTAGAYGHEDTWTHDLTPYSQNPYRGQARS